MHDNLENKYICQYCNKNYKYKSHLTFHIRKVHLGIKYNNRKHIKSGCFQKIKCEKCGNYFLKPNFQRHYNSCNCSGIKRYIKNKNTQKYIKDGLFVCECGKAFNNGMQLGSHFGSCIIHRTILGKVPKKSRKGEPFFLVSLNIKEKNFKEKLEILLNNE